MNKLKRLFAGGIRLKIFRMLLITIVLIIAAYTAVFFYQSNKVEQLVNETYETQKQIYVENGMEDQYSPSGAARSIPFTTKCSTPETFSFWWSY